MPTLRRVTSTDTERLPLSRDRIAEAALELVDEYGAEALSMRKLGSALGVEAMSLYNHVASKDDVLDALAEVVYREILADHVTDDSSSWVDDARSMVDAWRSAAHRHPNAFHTIADRPFAAVEGIRVFGQCYDIFTKAGISTSDAALAFDTAASWLVGSIRQELGLMVALERGDGFATSDVPAELASAAAFKEACMGWTADDRFERGFEILIAGIRSTFEV